MGAMAGGDGYLRIGELSRRTGVAPELLRAWERRYGLLRPARSEGGFRLYSEADEQRVERMRLHLREGLAAAEAARRAVEGVADATAAAARERPAGARRGRAAATDCAGRLRRGRSPGGARRPVRLVHGRDRPRRRDPPLPRRPRRALVDGRRDRRSGALRQQPDPWTVAWDRPRLGLGRGATCGARLRARRAARPGTDRVRPHPEPPRLAHHLPRPGHAGREPRGRRCATRAGSRRRHRDDQAAADPTRGRPHRSQPHRRASRLPVPEQRPAWTGFRRSAKTPSRPR